MEIIKLDFIKTPEGDIDLKNSSNLESLRHYIVPVMANNVGWGSGDMSQVEFEVTPQKFQDYINNSVDDNVHVLLNDEKESIGFIEYSIFNYATSTHKTIEILRSVMNNLNDHRWSDIVKTANISVVPDIAEVKCFLEERPMYYGVGITIAPRFQGKSTRYSNVLYELLKDGLVSGFTSNPVVVRKRQQTFKNTYYYPLFGEPMDTPEKFACHLHCWADIARHMYNETAGLYFGSRQADHFIERGTEFTNIADTMLEERKLTEIDYRRLVYNLRTKRTAGTIISHN